MTDQKQWENLHKAAEKSPKMQQMFEAVRDLLIAGADINTLKVSDITTRAGIGKGTAYEYFQSKEELIVKAVLYEFETMLEEVEAKLASCVNFRERYACILDWIEDHFATRNSLTLFMNLYQGTYHTSEVLKHEMMHQVHGFSCMEIRSREMLQIGIDEGTLRSDIPMDIMISLFLSSFCSLIYYLNQSHKSSHTDTSLMKKLLQEELFGILAQ